MGLIFVFSMILKSRNDVYSYKENVSVRVIFYKDILFKPERSSVPDESEQTRTFQKTGRATAPDIFENKFVAPIGDDQAALSRIGIPSVLIVGFEYEPWFNTTEYT